MIKNSRNIFQPYTVDGAAITDRLLDLIGKYGSKRIELALIFEMGDLWIKMHVDNLVATYSFTEVKEVFECLTKFNEGSA